MSVDSPRPVAACSTAQPNATSSSGRKWIASLRESGRSAIEMSSPAAPSRYARFRRTGTLCAGPKPSSTGRPAN